MDRFTPQQLFVLNALFDVYDREFYHHAAQSYRRMLL